MGKKKMSKEERKKFEAEKAEVLRIEMEKERFEFGTYFNCIFLQKIYQVSLNCFYFLFEIFVKDFLLNVHFFAFLPFLSIHSTFYAIVIYLHCFQTQPDSVN